MPLECENAFAPTMALLACTGRPVMRLTRRLAWVNSVASMSVWASSSSSCSFIAMTTSSMAVLPARSPRPFIVHSTCVAPFMTPASDSAVAMPRSLWQCTLTFTFSMPSTCSIRYLMRWPNSQGTEKPVVSGMFTTVAPAFTTA